MKYYCNPMNLEYRYQFFQLPEKDTRLAKGNREAADPSLILFKDKYYLFPSMTAGFFVSDNLADWEFHKLKNDMPVYDYAPDVRAIGDYLYFCASKQNQNCSFFRTKDPLSEPFEEIPGTFSFRDPNLFADDDGRFYFYWGCSNVTPIYGVELNPKTMEPLGEPREMFDSNEKERGYERNGENHIPQKTEEQIEQAVQAMLARMPEGIRKTAYPTLRSYMGNSPYIEGAWMTKYHGKYYLQYAIPGTQYNVYGDGVYVGDAPLGPFVPAKNNPYSYVPGGFITGAGHGSTLEDKQGRFWHTSTMRISKNHDFERRLGLWKAGIDEDGELFCNQRYSDWPINAESDVWEKPEWMLLSYGKQVEASSGEGTGYVTDENIRTWWKAGSSRPGEWVLLDLDEVKDVRAVQINFADDGLTQRIPDGMQFHAEQPVNRYIDETVQPTRWKLEGSADGENFFVLEDKSEAETDYSHDLLIWESGIKARFLRLTILQLPYDQVPCVSGLRVFGNGNGRMPAMAKNVKVVMDGDLDMVVSWDAADATGYNVLWGYAPDKLYHNYLGYGKSSQKIGALIRDESIYVRVDVFNEAGIAEGEVYRVR